MQQPTKILTIFGTRPEAIKLFPVVHALAADERFDARTCVTAQHRSMLDQVLEIAQIHPDHDLDLMRKDQTLDALLATLITEIGTVLDREKPDWVMVQGDTTTAMAGAMTAYHRKIRVVHVEAGLRSGDIYHPWPEEVNRKIIGSIAALHCAPTETAAKSLAKENVSSANVIVTGNTVIDALLWASDLVAGDPGLTQDIEPLRERFAGRKIIGVTTHRRENFGDGMRAIAAAIAEIARRPDVALIFPVHLNPNVRRIMTEQLSGLDNVALIEPLDYPNFVRLLTIADFMLTDSGGVQEEAPALGKPVLVMRQTTERPEGVEAGTARLIGTRKEMIVAEALRLLDDPEAYQRMARSHNPFGDGTASRKIADELARRGASVSAGRNRSPE